MVQRVLEIGTAGNNQNPLTAKVAKILRKDCKELKDIILTL
jgi:hypothetical protein